MHIREKKRNINGGEKRENATDLPSRGHVWTPSNCYFPLGSGTTASATISFSPTQKKERKECRAIEITTPWKMSKFVGRRKRAKDKVRVLGKLFTLFVIGKSFFSLLRKKRLRRKEKLSCLYKGKRVNPCQSGQCQMPHGCFYIFFLELLCACVVCSSGAFQYPPN